MGEAPDVVFVPDWRRGNPYQDLLAKGIEATGLRVTFADYPDGEFPLWTLVRRQRSIRVVHLHWTAPYLARVFWSGTEWKARMRIISLMLDVLLVRMRGIKVFWTMHNRWSHETPDMARELGARRAIARAVNGMMFHSVAARSEVERLLELDLHDRSQVIPHGNYVDFYAPDAARTAELRKRFELRAGDKVILFFGGIRRYKGLLHLLQAFNATHDPQLKLIVAGRPFERELAHEIERAMQQDSRISAYLGFIPEHDVHPLYSIADIAVVPFETTLTSGSAILAMSMGTALLLPEAARVLGLSDGDGIIFFEGPEALQGALQTLPSLDLAAMGQRNHARALQLDWQVIGRRTAQAYGVRINGRETPEIAPARAAAG
jgi:beta-1,4-mannosyltransferase